jgi:hypothetical protein
VVNSITSTTGLERYASDVIEEKCIYLAIYTPGKRRREPMLDNFSLLDLLKVFGEIIIWLYILGFYLQSRSARKLKEQSLKVRKEWEIMAELTREHRRNSAIAKHMQQATKEK